MIALYLILAYLAVGLVISVPVIRYDHLLYHRHHHTSYDEFTVAFPCTVLLWPVIGPLFIVRFLANTINRMNLPIRNIWVPKEIKKSKKSIKS